MTYDELAEQMEYEAVCGAQWEASERAEEAYWTRVYETQEQGELHE